MVSGNKVIIFTNCVSLLWWQTQRGRVGNDT